MKKKDKKIETSTSIEYQAYLIPNDNTDTSHSNIFKYILDKRDDEAAIKYFQEQGRLNKVWVVLEDNAAHLIYVNSDFYKRK